MDEPKVIVLVKDRTYLSVKDTSEIYGQSVPTVYRILGEMEGLERYKKARVTINDDGYRLINTLAYEDYLFYRSKLKNRNLSRHLPPYDPAAVREQHGEYMKVVNFGEVVV